MRDIAPIDARCKGRVGYRGGRGRAAERNASGRHSAETHRIGRMGRALSPIAHVEASRAEAIVQHLFRCRETPHGVARLEQVASTCSRSMHQRGWRTRSGRGVHDGRRKQGSGWRCRNGTRSKWPELHAFHGDQVVGSGSLWRCAGLHVAMPRCLGCG
eukprot:5809569-Prymnesium_polylepis.1